MMNNWSCKKSWSTRNLPLDVWSEILSWLPVQSLVRFRCVSPSWRVLIEDPDFGRSHLTRFNNRTQSKLFSYEGESDSKECVVRCSKTMSITARHGFPLHQSQVLQNWVVVCSVDGLFVLRNSKTYSGAPLVLWNPSIRKTLALPHPPQIPNCSKFCVEFGIGSDPFLKDYKLVALILDYSFTSQKFESTHFAVYTLGTHSWKATELQGEEFNFPHRFTTCFCLRGVLYTLVRGQVGRPIELGSFDLIGEVFSSTRLPLQVAPGSFSSSHSQQLTLINDGSSLALFDLFKLQASLWVVENLTPDFKSLIWTKRYTFSTTIIHNETLLLRAKLLYLNRDCEMFLHWRYYIHGNGVITSSSASSYNLETGKETIISTDVLPKIRAWPYIESLVLL